MNEDYGPMLDAARIRHARIVGALAALEELQAFYEGRNVRTASPPATTETPEFTESAQVYPFGRIP